MWKAIKVVNSVVEWPLKAVFFAMFLLSVYTLGLITILVDRLVPGLGLLNQETRLCRRGPFRAVMYNTWLLVVVVVVTFLGTAAAIALPALLSPTYLKVVMPVLLFMMVVETIKKQKGEHDEPDDKTPWQKEIERITSSPN